MTPLRKVRAYGAVPILPEVDNLRAGKPSLHMKQLPHQITDVQVVRTMNIASCLAKEP